MEKEPLPLGDWNRPLSALDRVRQEDEPEEPWDWDPESTESAPGAEPAAPGPAVVRSAAAIWAWVPDKPPVAPQEEAAPPAVEPEPTPKRVSKRRAKAAPEQDPALVPETISAWKWEADPAPAPALVAEPAPEPEPKRRWWSKAAPAPEVVLAPAPEVVLEREVAPTAEPEIAPTPRSKRKRKPEPEPAAEPVAEPKRKRKAKAEPAPEPVAEPVAEPKRKRKSKAEPAPEPTPEVVGKRRRGRKNVVVPDWESLEPEPVAEPDAPASRRRRTVKIAAVVFVVGVCATLPWAVPQIPDLFAKAVPEPTSSPHPTDPKIDPPSSPTATVTGNPTLLGTRLKSAGKPLELWVPRLKVRSEVVPISGQSGELLPPDDPQILGWWQEGRYAGAGHGSVVITGHTVNGGGGAFDHLGELVPGDKIRVRTEAGSIRYVVQQSRDVSVDKLARTAEEIFRQSGDGRLVLITCSDFNGEVYLSNSVVYATPVKDEPNKPVESLRDYQEIRQ
ncbi:class F sortase [Nocardioides marmoriginsengisoli]|uniref:Class F sortase n=1 Tax=Nocardioides marmoriginsengisoli TaxID=661483 RepID=A0A3N0CFZ1_9ACTN|nr:class F sortase [Nocardioides marmoriginsengisoli]RNL62390.1 class F sortase [Nocardioides marmoriginsengisoli]